MELESVGHNWVTNATSQMNTRKHVLVDRVTSIVVFWTVFLQIPEDLL